MIALDKKTMKIVGVDNFGREIADILIAKDVKRQYAEAIVEFLNSRFSSDISSIFFVAKEDSYVLHRGLKDLL